MTIDGNMTINQLIENLSSENIPLVEIDFNGEAISVPQRPNQNLFHLIMVLLGVKNTSSEMLNVIVGLMAELYGYDVMMLLQKKYPGFLIVGHINEPMEIISRFWFESGAYDDLYGAYGVTNPDKEPEMAIWNNIKPGIA